jgi:hypothetical protein
MPVVTTHQLRVFDEAKPISKTVLQHKTIIRY